MSIIVVIYIDWKLIKRKSKSIDTIDAHFYYLIRFIKLPLMRYTYDTP